MNDVARYAARFGHVPLEDEFRAPSPLGMVTHGSLLKGLRVRLEHGTTVEDMRVGRFMVIEGQDNRFFCLVTDMELGMAGERMLLDPPNRAHPLVAEMLEDIATYGVVDIQPMLMLPRSEEGGAAGSGLEPVRTIPVHFSPVYDATARRTSPACSGAPRMIVARFAIDQPLNMDIPVCLDLERIAERSNGVFGKSGTGKSFLTRLLLAGIISRDVASTLVFDMHSEYGWETQSEEGVGQRKVLPGLRRLFGSRVHVYTIDPESSRARGVRVDGELTVGLNQIDIADIALLEEELDLSVRCSRTPATSLARRPGRRLATTLLRYRAARHGERGAAGGSAQGITGGPLSQAVADSRDGLRPGSAVGGPEHSARDDRVA